MFQVKELDSFIGYTHYSKAASFVVGLLLQVGFFLNLTVTCNACAVLVLSEQTSH